MEVKIYIPHPALQPYVVNIMTINAVLPNGMRHVVTPYPPAPFQSLIFYCKNPISSSLSYSTDFVVQPISILIGPQLSRVNVKVDQQLRSIRVDFVPGGLYRIMGIPMQELFDCGYDATDFFGNNIRNVNEQLFEIEELETGKTIVENFLMTQLNKVKNILPFDAAIGLLLKNNGHMSIDKVASLSCLSVKQFERVSKERLGMNPKLYARILKFSKAYRLREAKPHLKWIEIAYEAGYFDQMHLIRDFKVFAGVNPSVIEQQLLATPLRMQKDILI